MHAMQPQKKQKTSAAASSSSSESKPGVIDATSIVTGVISSLLFKLGELLKGEYDLQTGVKDQIRSLREELECAHAALVEVAQVPADHELDPQVRIWARQVREASYDMEDILDTFLLHVEGPADNPAATKDDGWFSRLRGMMAKLFNKSRERHSIARAIQDIHKRLKEVTDRRDMYAMNTNRPLAPPLVDPRLEAMHIQVEQLIGIEDSSAELKSMLLWPQLDHDAAIVKKMKIVSVVGVGGLGKTTLVKAVYDQLNSEYDCKAFVSVGRNTDLERVFKDILFHLNSRTYENIHNSGRGLQLLIDQLKAFLTDSKRYFIVIDDVWDLESWRNIKLALIENNSGSRVITTTRNYKVAEKADEVYRPPPLSDDNSKKLFSARLFDANTNQRDEVPQEVIRKCAGVPLAIITMASLLANKPRDKWIEVCKSIGFRDRDNKQVDDTMRILACSFDDMPPHLKTCLLYLSAYPEDYQIDKDALIWKWVAEGFVTKKQGVGLFELGESYFNDLISRSMIQPIIVVWTGFVYQCRVHDIILDFIRDLSNDENFVNLLDDDNGGGTSSSSQCIVRRRLAHQDKTAELETIATQVNAKEMQKVRSYIVCSCDISRLVPLESFKHLRVLALEHCNNVKGRYLENLGNLLHLRYLGLQNTPIDVLPEQIGNLKFLEVIDLTETKLHELPASISRLTRLRCLKCPHAIDSECFIAWGMGLENGFANMTSLEELNIIPAVAGRDKMSRLVQGLGSLRELRLLYITFPTRYDALERDLLESLRKLQKLQKLFIEGDIKRTWDFVLPQNLRYLHLGVGIKFSGLPSCINLSYLHYLTDLKLHVTDMDQQVLRFMGALPELRYLCLQTDSTLTSTINVGDPFFQKLRFFDMPGGMIQFQLNEDGSAISFHIWNIAGAIPFGPARRNGHRMFVMPNLDTLKVHVYVEELLHANSLDSYCGNIGLEYLPSLRRVDVMFWRDVIIPRAEDPSWLTEAKAAVRKEIEGHRNRPYYKII